MMRCIAIDDEPLALKQISAYIQKTPFLELAAACRSAVEAMALLKEEPADLLFVDINMPDLNGLDFVRALTVKPLVIFTTAYSEYALEGYKVDATDYLLKPVSYADFLRASEKAYAQFRLIRAAAEHVDDTAQNHLFVRSDYRTLRIDTDDILYIESMSEYVRIYMVGGGKPVTTLGSLKTYAEKLPAASFMRVHRSYIVNLNRIAAVERRNIILDGGGSIPIGEMYEENFKNYLASKSLV